METTKVTKKLAPSHNKLGVLYFWSWSCKSIGEETRLENGFAVEALGVRLSPTPLGTFHI